VKEIIVTRDPKVEKSNEDSLLLKILKSLESIKSEK
jgi:hypothetical protein